MANHNIMKKVILLKIAVSRKNVVLIVLLFLILLALIAFIRLNRYYSFIGFTPEDAAQKAVTETTLSAYPFRAAKVTVDEKTDMVLMLNHSGDDFAMLFTKKKWFFYYIIGFSCGHYDSLVDGNVVQVSSAGVGDRQTGFTVVVFRNLPKQADVKKYDPIRITTVNDFTFLVWNHGKQTPNALYDDYQKIKKTS